MKSCFWSMSVCQNVATASTLAHVGFIIVWQKTVNYDPVETSLSVN